MNEPKPQPRDIMSETLETEQCSICLASPPYSACAGDESCAYIMKLERELRQAEIGEFQEHERAEKAATALTQAQARCAEVEKDAARYRFLAGQNNDWHVERWTDSPRASGTWKVFRGGELTRAIDSAMEPTKKMIETGKDRLNSLNNSYGVKLERCAVLVWNAMLAAAEAEGHHE